MKPDIRHENPDDAEQIREVTERAFLNAPHTAHTEQFIIAALRRAGALSLSLVAETNGKILGHAAISPVSISDGSAGWFGLGPISVLPEHQGQGLGSRLMEQALAALRQKGAAGCVVLGEPAYYGRFGFKAVDGLSLPGIPAGYFQALSFNEKSWPQGEVLYHEAFSARE